MTREWEKFTNDELSCIWKGFLQTEFKNYDILRLNIAPSITEMRLTPMEIIRLVDELMKRLDIKCQQDELK